MLSCYLDSPVGLLKIEASDTGISSVLFEEERVGEESHSELLSECVKQLKEYFDGERKSFSLPLDFSGTDFQKNVWNELVKIPFGKTISYLELARRLGDEKKIRAAGTANGRNPIVIIVPCHRVIGSDGSLVGYGGGLWRKKWLLEWETKSVQQSLFSL